MLTLAVELSNPVTDYPPISDTQVKTALRRALNKTARRQQLQIARDVAAELKLQVHVVKKQLQVHLSRGRHSQAVIALGKQAGVLPAIKLGASRQTQQGVRTGRRFWDKSFLATMPSGHRGVFKRQGKARLPIQERKLVLTGRIKHAMEACVAGDMRHHFEKTFAHELNFMMSKR